jgi:hypothetical protein
MVKSWMKFFMVVRLSSLACLHLGLFAPLILLTDSSLFLRGEVIDNVELFSDLLNRHSLDHSRELSTTQIKERLQVEVIGSKNELEQNLLLHSDEFNVPLADVVLR